MRQQLDILNRVIRDQKDKLAHFGKWPGRAEAEMILKEAERKLAKLVEGCIR